MANTFHKLILNLLIITALVLLAMGVFLPMMTLQKFYFFENQVSLYSALNELLFNREWILFVVIFIFSIVFPIVKSLFLFLVVNMGQQKKQAYKTFLKVLSGIGKWSMLDVFVVAILLVTVKLEMIADVQIHQGIYAFGASVLLTMVLTQWIHFFYNKN